jgi:hypothetical protein
MGPIRSGRSSTSSRRVPRRSLLGAVRSRARQSGPQPIGETWAGRGLAPKAFTTRAKSVDGKARALAHPGGGGKFPSVHFQAQTGGFTISAAEPRVRNLGKGDRCLCSGLCYPNATRNSGGWLVCKIAIGAGDL